MMDTRASLLRRLELEMLRPTSDEIRPVAPRRDGAELLALVEKAAREIPPERWSRRARRLARP